MEPLPSLFADASASRQSEKKPHKRVYIALGILAGIIVLSGLATLAVVGLKGFAKSVEEPMTALNIYTDVLVQQDYQSAYEIVSPDFRQQTSFPALVEFHRGLTSKLGALKSAKQTYWELDANNGVTSCRIQTTLKFERGSEAFEFVLHKEAGIWRIHSYKPLSESGAGIGN